MFDLKESNDISTLGVLNLDKLDVLEPDYKGETPLGRIFQREQVVESQSMVEVGCETEEKLSK